MALSVKLELTKESKRMLKKFPNEFKKGFYKGLQDSIKMAEREAKLSFGKSGKPKVRTGHLRRSIQSNVKEDFGDNLMGVLSSDVEYAAVHEFGGRIKPRSSEYLKFQINGQWISTKEIIIPPRPFLEPAIRDNLERIEAIIQDRILQEVRR